MIRASSFGDISRAARQVRLDCSYESSTDGDGHRHYLTSCYYWFHFLYDYAYSCKYYSLLLLFVIITSFRCWFGESYVFWSWLFWAVFATCSLVKINDVGVGAGSLFFCRPPCSRRASASLQSPFPRSKLWDVSTVAYGLGHGFHSLIGMLPQHDRYTLLLVLTKLPSFELRS